MKIAVVIVTFNRLEKLRKALACYEAQTAPFESLTVVDNHSQDGTAAFLSDWAATPSSFARYVVTTADNLGGAGGFHLGEQEAMRLSPDWVFVADDDAYPDPDLMAQFRTFAASHPVAGMSAVCGAVYHPAGDIEYQHRSRFRIVGHRFLEVKAAPPACYEEEAFQIDILSNVGSFLNARALQLVGPVRDDYFIYYDDTEHSLRLRHYGPIWCVPALRIAHDNQATRKPDAVPVQVSWDEYYFTRNQHHMLRMHFPMVALNALRIAWLHRLRHVDNPARNSLRWQAVKDAWLGRMGRHAVYLPGWTIPQSPDTPESCD